MISLSSGARIVDFPCEMYNDAIFFKEQAIELDAKTENDWLRWRYLRASIILSFSSFESYLNSFIKARIPDKAFANVFDKAKFPWDFSLRTIVPEITGGKITEDSLKKIRRIAKIRNRLIHYSGDTRLIYEDTNPEGINANNAEKSIQMVRDIIKQLNALIGQQYPPWVDQTHSWIIR